MAGKPGAQPVQTAVSIASKCLFIGAGVFTMVGHEVVG